MNAPDVSILVVAYNRAHTLPECLDSILMQSYPSREVLLIDDGSTDGTAGVARSYGGKIAYHRLNHAGLSRARNAAIARSRGRWIAFLDSDDYYLYPDVIRDYMDRLRQDPGVDALSSGWRLVDETGRPLADVHPWQQAPVFDLEACLYWKPTFPSSKIFRRKIFEKAGGFDPEFESSMDTDFFFRILLAGARIGWLKKITCCLRQSPDSMLVDAPRDARYLRMALDRTFSSPSLSRRLRSHEHEIRCATEVWLAWNLWSRGFPSAASESLRQSRRRRREAPLIQLIRWWRSFHRSACAAGGRQIQPEEFLSLSLPALSLTGKEQDRCSLWFRRLHSLWNRLHG
ncbi:MAG: glycosyltransferase [Anaerolineales bacterium]